jgi:hypothetical protein
MAAGEPPAGGEADDARVRPLARSTLRLLIPPYLAAERALRCTLAPLHPYWSGFWLGVLSEPALAVLDRTVYQSGREYRSREHNLRGLFPWEAEAVALHFEGCRQPLVLGVGGGREVIALRRMGIEATGWECNPVLQARAEELVAEVGFPGSVRLGPRSAVPPLPEPVDGAILGWSMYMLISGRERRVRLLRDLRSRLHAGAPLLLSFYTRTAADEGRLLRVARTADRIRGLLGRPPVEPGDETTPTFVHWFTRDEVDSELSEGRFTLVRWEPMGEREFDSGWAVGLAT